MPVCPNGCAVLLHQAKVVVVPNLLGSLDVLFKLSDSEPRLMSFGINLGLIIKFGVAIEFMVTGSGNARGLS